MQEIEQSHTREVKIEKLLTKGVIQEGVQDFRESLVSQEYHQAVDVLKQILHENNTLRSEENIGLSINGVGRNAGKRREIFNVIPFIGERGTGKTSVMLSFANMLAGFDQMKDAYASFLLDEDRYSQNNFKFVVLQYIDVSVLKSKEDMMAIILARMLKYIKRVVDRSDSPGYGVQTVRQEELRQLYQRFERVYSDLLNLTQESQVLEGESVLRKLQNLNSSYSLSEKFQELVGAFLHFLSHNDDSHNRQYYLVIALDDIDLYEPSTCEKGWRKDAYTILGQVYEYLQIPGVIVLTTYDEARLVWACVEHVKNTFPYIEEGQRRTQVTQYIHKVILPKYKIYMPSLGYTDYPEERQLSIVIDKGTRLSEILFSGKSQEKDKYGLTPKELMLAYLANRYGCYFDTQGKKQHFFEKRTLREIKNMFLALQADDGQPFSAADEKVQEQRYMHLMSYIYNQFNGEMLAGTKENTLLRSWLSMPVERRSKEIWEYIQAGRSELDKESRYYYKAVRNERKYSYGELMYNLYCSSRCGVLSKEMVYCILASYSLVLPQLYLQYRNGEGAVSNYAYNSLRKVLGTSISGRWSNEILYTTFCYSLGVTTKVESAEAQIGSVSTERGDLAFKIPISEDKKREIYWVFYRVKPGKKAQDSFRKFLHALEIMGMFFTNVRSAKREEQKEWKNADYRFKIGPNERGDDENAPGEQKIPLAGQLTAGNVLSQDSPVYLMPEAKFACFNVLNFVTNSFTWKEYFETLHNSLLDAMAAFGKEEFEKFELKQKKSTQKEERPELLNAMAAFYKGSLEKARRAELLDIMSNYSLVKSFEEWDKEYGSCAIPFQHFDMTYNILKRQRDDTNHGLPERAGVSEFCACCGKVYDNISAALKEQDDYYENYCTFKFRDAFEKNPFIENFRACARDEEFRGYLEGLARVLVRETFARQQDVISDRRL